MGKLLNERADILCKELKQLNLEEEEEAVNADEEMVNEGTTEDFKEIMRQYSDFIIIIRENDDDQETEVEMEVSSIIEEAPLEDNSEADRVQADINKNEENEGNEE